MYEEEFSTIHIKYYRNILEQLKIIAVDSMPKESSLIVITQSLALSPKLIRPFFCR